jgi:glycine/D-amino acid oxidase-like deaminating enzyme
MKVDYLIVGQGLSGSFLSKYLLEAGSTLLVIDELHPNTASRVASGIINPITGRRLVKTWEIDQFMPFAREAYSNWEPEIGKKLIRATSILDFPVTPQMHLAFQERANEEPMLGYPDAPEHWRPLFNYPFPPGEIKPAYLIDIHSLLDNWRILLQNQQLIREEKFDYAELKISATGIEYRDISAQKIIFCDGALGGRIPLFSGLPFVANKGEVIWVKIPALPPDHIYKMGLSIVPWEDDVFWVGSTYEWDFEHEQPTDAFRERVTSLLQQWLKVPFTLLEHKASLRPANLERRPFVGIHPVYPAVGILNGMGTKGCSLAPWFARELANHLLLGHPIHPQADVHRFAKILSRLNN